MTRTEQAYDFAAGRCIDAMQSLRRFAGKEAIESLQRAIKEIEQEQRQARREDRLLFACVPDIPAAQPPDLRPDAAKDNANV